MDNLCYIHKQKNERNKELTRSDNIPTTTPQVHVRIGLRSWELACKNRTRKLFFRHCVWLYAIFSFMSYTCAHPFLYFVDKYICIAYTSSPKSLHMAGTISN